MIREEVVDCVTFDDLLSRLPDSKLDLLQIDAEGEDSRLLELFPFSRLRPAIIHWEIKHTTVTEQEDCLDRLADFGYRFAKSDDEDLIAVL